MVRGTIFWLVVGIVGANSVEAAPLWEKLETRRFSEGHPQERIEERANQRAVRPEMAQPVVERIKIIRTERLEPIRPLKREQLRTNRFLWRTAKSLDGDVVNVAMSRSETSVTAVLPTGIYGATLKNRLWSTKSGREKALKSLLAQYPEPRKAGSPSLIRGNIGETTPAWALLPAGLAGTFSGRIDRAPLHAAAYKEALDAKISPAQTRFVNLVPTEEKHIDKMQLAGTVELWRKEKRAYDKVASEHNIHSHEETKEGLLEALSSDSDVVVIVAHGDSQGIYAPDGTKVDASDIQNMAFPKRAAGKRPPVVVMMVCESGMNPKASKSAVAGASTISRALVDSGRASVVVAPTGVIPLGGPTLELLRRLFKQKSLRELMEQLPGSYNVTVERLVSSALERNA